MTTPNEPPLNQKDSPQAPQAGGGAPENPEMRKRFDYFFTNCIGWRRQALDRPLSMFRLLSEPEQIACAAASPVHAAECTRDKRKSRDAWKLIRDRFWASYPDARLPAPPPEKRWISDPVEIGALAVLAVISDTAMPRLIDDPERGQGLWRLAPVDADLRALAMAERNTEAMELVSPEDPKPYAAWRQRLHDWTGRWIEPRVVMRPGTKPMVIHPGQPAIEVRNRASGIPVPWRWPPKKDGTIHRDDDTTATTGEQR